MKSLLALYIMTVLSTNSFCQSPEAISSREQKRNQIQLQTNIINQKSQKNKIKQIHRIMKIQKFHMSHQRPSVLIIRIKILNKNGNGKN